MEPLVAYEVVPARGPLFDGSFTTDLQKVCLKVMDLAAEKFVGYVQDFIDSPPLGHRALIDRGFLRNSVQPLKATGSLEKGFQARVWSTPDAMKASGQGTSYAAIMEFGTKPHAHHPPPVEGGDFPMENGRRVYEVTDRAGNPRRVLLWWSVLAPWIERKTGLMGNRLSDARIIAGIAYRMGERFKDHGIEGRFFFREASVQKGPEIQAWIKVMFTDGLQQLVALRRTGAA